VPPPRGRRLLLGATRLAVAVALGTLGLLGAGPGQAAPARAPGQDALEGRYLAERGGLGGLVSAVDARGSLAYLAVGPRVVVLDVSRPEAPRVRGQTPGLPGPIAALALRPPQLYVAVGPARIGGSRRVAADSSGVWVLDVTEPTLPLVAGAFVLPPGGEAQAIALDGPRLILAAGRAGLLVLDIANPAVPQAIGSVDVGADLVGVGWVSPYALATVESGGVVLVDCRDPARPKDLGLQADYGLARFIDVQGGLAVVGSGDGYQVLDITQAEHPLPLLAQSRRGVRGLRLADGVAYILRDDALIELLDLGTLQGIGAWPVQGVVQSVAPVAGALVVATTDGLRVLDAEPSAVELGAWFALMAPRRLALSQGHVLAVDESTGLHVLDAVDPDAPRMVAHYGGAGLQDVAVAEGHAFVAAGALGLRVVDVTQPAFPREVAALMPDANPNSVLHVADVALGTGLAWLLVRRGGSQDHVWLLDVSRPTAPRDLGLPRSGIGAPALALAAAGRRGYVLTRRQLLAFEVDPEGTVRQVRAIDLPSGPPTALGVSGERMYWAASGMLQWLDLSAGSPSGPPASYPAGFGVSQIATQGGVVMLGGLRSGADGQRVITEVLAERPDGTLRPVARWTSEPGVGLELADGAAVALDGELLVSGNVIGGLQLYTRLTPVQQLWLPFLHTPYLR
jgi:hypothetical protein